MGSAHIFKLWLPGHPRQRLRDRRLARRFAPPGPSRTLDPHLTGGSELADKDKPRTTDT